jgi:hypothetical protein
MIPKAAFLGSRPARNTGENPFGQRADGDFEEIRDKYGDVEDVQWESRFCRNPKCHAEDAIYNDHNGYKVCSVCLTIQNDGIPEGKKELSKTKKKKMLRDFTMSLGNGGD